MAWEHLPHDTRTAVQDRIRDCRNLGLILDRLNPWGPHENRWDLVFEVERKQEGQWNRRTVAGGEAKGFWLSDWRGDRRQRPLDEPLLRHPRIDGDLLAAHNARWTAQVRAWGAEPFYGYTESRLVIGLGTDSVLETSLTLHRVYGYPFIPGSALKGATRQVALLEIAEKLVIPVLSLEDFWRRKPPGQRTQESTPLNKLGALLEAPLQTTDSKTRSRLESQLESLKRDPALAGQAAIKAFSLCQLASDPCVQDFQAVFGFLGRAGEVVFFDGIPSELPNLVPDVMNPHYPNYYRGQGFPHDGDQPIPVSFLAVAEGVRFGFAVASRLRGRSTGHEAVGKARQWLETALLDMGIGAKTGAGYGLFGSRASVAFESAEPEPKPPHHTPDPQPPSTNRDQDRPEEKDEEVSEFAKRFARFLGTEE